MNIKDQEIADVIRDLERRADRQENEAVLHSTFVDSGVLSELSNTESQVIYGRRGVGKSHLLHFHRHQTSALGYRTRYFIIDCRNLGSGTATISDDPTIVARNYAKEIFSQIANLLFDSADALELDAKSKSNALEAAFQLSEHILRPNGTFDYSNVSSTLTAFCLHGQLDRVFIGLDEFVAIPQAAQAYVAHHLKLAFAANPKVVLKIAAVTFQTTLFKHDKEGLVGLELGADVFSDIDLDSYFLWDENPDWVVGFLSQVLYNHIADGIGWPSNVNAWDKFNRFTNTFFTQEKVFQELARASEGNCRDLMNIFRLAYFSFRRDTEAVRIGIAHVTNAAIEWYRQAKLTNLSAKNRDVEFLNFLIQDVIKARRSRSFMVHYTHASHPLLLRLLNLRLLHRQKASWTHPDRPGEPYNIFVIDYGCYAELKGTRSEPNQQVFFAASDPTIDVDDLVPLPSRKSIRRIILSIEQIQKFAE